MPKIPWNKIKELAKEHFDEMWREEERELRRIIETAKPGEKAVTVGCSFVIDCDSEPIAIKSKLNFTEKFSTTMTGTIDDPAQMTLDEAKPNGETRKK